MGASIIINDDADGNMQAFGFRDREASVAKVSDEKPKLAVGLTRHKLVVLQDSQQPSDAQSHASRKNPKSSTIFPRRELEPSCLNLPFTAVRCARD